MKNRKSAIKKLFSPMCGRNALLTAQNSLKVHRRTSRDNPAIICKKQGLRMCPLPFLTL